MTDDELQQTLELSDRLCAQMEQLLERGQAALAETEAFYAEHGIPRDAPRQFLTSARRTPEQRQQIDAELAAMEAEIARDLEAAVEQHRPRPQQRRAPRPGHLSV
ncbi:hypothetical protein [uncultured Thiohalocapsa sp.]|uniref:hypothetical protein n=1 Tax=uncultured Thiohalocapsa sp. TaxID=768990 RepID=UPI0025DCB8E3|nr:hypothetical protein [uncultured Thiohalocapsa sp.]